MVAETGESGTCEFRWLLRGETASVFGDQLAKVGVSLLVFERTHSAALTGLTYALTLLPDLIAGPVLSPLADRYSPRAVMTVTALLQALLAMLMAVPGIHVAVIGVAVAGIAAGQAPYKAAQAVLVRDVLDQGRNKAGQVTLTMIRELGQLAGLG
ncbi:MAG: MFS transporter, partial [Sciscionella sp.]